ncbi:MAG: MFS transporter [Candidatus Eisenbacteria bacterium]|nr:MFS transporter [Candidatus Eisenbacteria bacterium]
MSSAPAPEGVFSGFRALRHRNFRLFWSGQAVSLIGTWMQSVAQGWLMHELTGSPWMLGLLSFMQFIPVLPFALLAGVVADRTDKRRLLFGTQTAFLVQATVLALTVSLGVVKPWMVLGLAFAYGVANTFDLPARQALVIDLTGREDLSNGIALNSAAFNTARILGPSFAGLMLATIGVAGCFWINALSFVAVLAALAVLQVPPQVGVRSSRPLTHTLVEGVRYAWETASLRHLLVLLGVCAGFGFQYSVLLPVYADTLLHEGPQAYGALLAAFGVGSLLAAVRMTMRLDRWALRRHLLVGLTLGGLGFVGFAWVRSLPVMMLMGAIAGFGLILYVSSTNVLIQMTTADEFRGRVMSLYTLMFVGTSPFGALLAGGLAQRFGAPVATTVCALFMLGGALWVALRLRAIAAGERPVVPPSVDAGAAR